MASPLKSLAISWLSISVAISSAIAEDVFHERPKLALVIANARYRAFNQIPQTYRDAEIVSEVLTSAGFDVVIFRDLNSERLYSQILDLARRATVSRTEYVNPLVLLYFSGHGFSRNGQQFLVGVDAGINQDPIVESTSLDTIVSQFNGKGIFVGIIDACRTQLRWRESNKPVDSDPVFVSKNQDRTKDLTGTNSRAIHSDYLIGYANGFGKPVLASTPSNGDNSPFSDGIRRYAARGSTLNSELDAIGEYLALDLKVDQSPGVEDYIYGEVYLRFRPQTLEEMEREWNGILENPEKELVKEFLRRYRNGPYAAEAKRWITLNGN
ncbi:caspase family protein [Sinorhizobium meliloti]|uniref:caspase family protein n=1 Tax=Rhizobium meliloti TaxID=382 RepID=UPI000FDC938D|nr:caspase family protein [Sinorhizobium meliloti]RVG07958.1 caspase family protein [Sinorhizobium meliloti]